MGNGYGAWKGGVVLCQYELSEFFVSMAGPGICIVC